MSQPKPPTTARRKWRKTPLHTLTLSDETWERLAEIARREGHGSRSATVTRLVEEARLPR